MTSSVVVVEIDTRKGPVKTVFESSIENQTEQAKQFWKTLTLAPHIESSLYSKEIMQKIKPNSLKPLSIDNSRKPKQVDPKTQAFIKHLQVLNQVDEIMKIQKKSSKIESIRQMHKTAKEKSNQINNISRSHIKSESDNKWNLQLNESNDKFNYNEKINEQDYEFEADDIPDEDVVKNLD